MIKTMLLVLLSVTACASALPLELGSPFSENMVLQRQSTIPVWGWAAPNKEPIGRRLAWLAMPQADRTGRVQGPAMKSVTIKPPKVVIALDNAEGLTTTDGKSVRGFWVAGKDRQWKSVAGRIDGKTVVLDCGSATPEVIRYAFCAVPDVNLDNAARIPALPFRTDKDKP